MAVSEPGFAQDHPLVDVGGDAYLMTVRDHTRPWAFVFNGEWVAECPVNGCNNVEFLTTRLPEHRGRRDLPPGPVQPVFACRNCLTVSPHVEWPDHPDDLMAVLNRRPVPQTRNWYPDGHPHALKWAGTPHGQSVADLEQENRDHGVN